MTTYPCRMVDGNGVPVCTDACRHADRINPIGPEDLMHCRKTEARLRTYEVCYFWALSKVDDADEFNEGEEALR